MRVAVCALALAIGCSAAAPVPAPTVMPASAPAPALAPAPAGTIAAAESDGPEALPDEQHARVVEINAAYREETRAAAWAARFEKEGREVRDKQAEVLAALAVAPGASVADIGAGTGLYSMAFSDVVGEQGRVYAVDIQPYFIEHLQQRARDEGRSNVQPVLATASSSALPAGTVDLAFLCDAYHHIEQPAAYLRSLHSALREGGRLVVIDYHRGEPGAWTYDHIRATAAEFRGEIEAAGFELEREYDFLDENFFFVFRRT